MHSRRSMSQVYLVSMLLLTVIPTVAIGLFWVSQRNQQFEAELDAHRRQGIATRRQFLQDQVAEIIAYIEHRKAQSDQLLRERLQQRVDETHILISSLHDYFQPASKHDRDTLVRLIGTLLRPIRFSEARGGFMLINSAGTILLNPAFPDIDDRDITREAINIAQENGEGFLSFAANRAGAGDHFPQRLTYVKFFQPLDLIVLAGDDAQDVERKLREDVLKLINTAQYYPQRSIPFVMDREGIFLAEPTRPELIGKDSTAIVDVRSGESLLALHRRAVDESGGGFIEYSDQLSKRISFMQDYPAWGWIVGSGFLLDQLEADIAAEREALARRVTQEISYVAVGVVVWLVLVVMVARRFARQTASGFRQFNRFFSEASRNASHIDQQHLPYSEFFQLADSANAMIDERTRYEQALMQNEQRFKLALKHARHYLWDIQVDSGTVAVDSGFYESLGYSTDDIDFEQLETVYRLCHPDDLEMAKAELQLRNIRKGGLEFRLRDKAGNYRWFFGRGSVVKSSQQTLGPRLLGIVTEVTPRKQMEQELIDARIAAEEANYAKSQFLAAMSHELRTPLNGILGSAQLMMRAPALPEEYLQYLHSITKCGQRLLAMIGDILQLSKFDSSSLSFQPCRLETVVQEFNGIVAAKARDKGLEFSWYIDPAVPEIVLTDAARLKQILVNLLFNAIKFTARGWVRLSVEYDRNDRMLSFVVSDSGAGIAAQDLQRIFEPFQQVEDADSSGAGLGLTISRRLAEALSGELTVSSELGKGSQFLLRLPVVIGAVGEGVLADPVAESGTSDAAAESNDQHVNLTLEAAAALLQVLRSGDIERLRLLMQDMTVATGDAAMKRWLQRMQESLGQFDLETVERMIRESSGLDEGV